MLNLTGKQETFIKQVPRNLIANMLYFVLNVLIGLFLVPYFIDTLGVASYALIPLATSMTSYVNMMTQSLNASVSRYLTIDLQKHDYKAANKTFNTALFTTLGITLATVPLILIVSNYYTVFFDVPISQKQDASILFLGVMGAVLIKTWSSNYGVSLFAYNRLDLQNIIEIINVTIQFLLIVTLFSSYSPKLSYIGFSYFIASIIAFLITLAFSKKINPHFKVNIKDFRKSRLKELVGTGSWLMTDQIGTLLIFQIDIIVVNKLFGASAGGEYSIILLWNTLIRIVAVMLAGVLTPVILTYYAQNKFGELVNISRSAVKLMGLLMALPIGLICGFSPFILSLWVGPEYARLSPLMWVLLIHLSINMSVLPLFPINVAYNKVRIPAIITILLGIVNVLLAVAIPAITGWGYYGVAIAGAIVLTTRHFFFIPMYATRVLGIAKNTFQISMLQAILSTLVVAGIASIANHLTNSLNLSTFIFYCVIITIVYLLMTWFIFINKSERKIIDPFIPSMFKK